MREVVRETPFRQREELKSDARAAGGKQPHSILIPRSAEHDHGRFKQPRVKGSGESWAA